VPFGFSDIIGRQMSSKKNKIVPRSSRKAGSPPGTHRRTFTKNVKRFIEDLRKFLQRARKDVFWLSASGVLSAIFIWQIHTALKVIPTLLAFERDSNRFHSEASEGDKVLLLLDTIRGVVKTLEQTANEYQATFAGRYPAQVDSTAVGRGLASIRVARQQVEGALSLLRGMQFDEEKLEAYRRGFVDDLGMLSVQSSEIEAVYTTWEQGDVKAHETAIHALRDGKDPSLDGITLIARLDSFMAQANSLQRGWHLDVIEGLEGQKVFTAREIAFALGLLYELGFFIVGVVAFRKHRSGKGSSR
jgi:hypothetical protein